MVQQVILVRESALAYWGVVQSQLGLSATCCLLTWTSATVLLANSDRAVSTLFLNNHPLPSVEDQSRVL
jgi:hypothetical protein